MSIDHSTELSGRVAALDSIASVLPMDRRDELTELLTDQDIETLRHLVNEGAPVTASPEFSKRQVPARS